jgi:hypothetical protein
MGLADSLTNAILETGDANPDHDPVPEDTRNTLGHQVETGGLPGLQACSMHGVSFHSLTFAQMFD